MIFSRLLKVRVGDSSSDVALRFFAPIERGPDWSCRFEIDWPSGTMRKEAFGFDSVQAALLAFQMAGAIIYASTYHRDGLLWWDKPGDGYGLPVPAGMRDMLVGSDRTYT